MERDVAELVLAQRYDEAARFLEGELASCDDDMRKLALMKDLATLRTDHLGDIAGAMDAYPQALEIDSTDGDALRELAKECVELSSPGRALLRSPRLALWG